MADDAATRQRRNRRHKQGDHSLCVAGRCEALGGAVKSVPEQIVTIPAEPVTVGPGVTGAPTTETRDRAGRMEGLASEFVSTLRYAPTDPRSLIAQMAIELARRIDEAGPVPAAVRELRTMLMQLAEGPNGPSGLVDEMRVRHHQQQLDALLAVAAAA